MVLHRGNAGGRPGGAFGDLSLVPGMDLAAESHLAALGLNGDPRRVQLGVPVQRLLDFILDLDNRYRRVDQYQIGDAGNTGELVDSGFGFALLKPPIDIAGQG